jgi:hypothetical protein
VRASSASCRNATLATRGSARLTGHLVMLRARFLPGLLGRMVSRCEPSPTRLRGVAAKPRSREQAQKVARHHAHGGSVPQPKMARTERHHLPALRLAAINRQSTFTTAVIKAGADRQAQWWRCWDDHPYIGAIGDWCGHIRPLRLRQIPAQGREQGEDEWALRSPVAIRQSIWTSPEKLRGSGSSQLCFSG